MFMMVYVCYSLFHRMVEVSLTIYFKAPLMLPSHYSMGRLSFLRPPKLQ